MSEMRTRAERRNAQAKAKAKTIAEGGHDEESCQLREVVTDAERDRQRSDRRDLCRGLYARQYGDIY
jgi:hypothetical protein